jgi:hypothetical protein
MQQEANARSQNATQKQTLNVISVIYCQKGWSQGKEIREHAISEAKRDRMTCDTRSARRTEEPRYR